MRGTWPSQICYKKVEGGYNPPKFLKILILLSIFFFWIMIEDLIKW